jgi:hypothetical protein
LSPDSQLLIDRHFRGALRFQLSQKRKGLTLGEETNIQDRRNRLQSRVDSYNQMSHIFLPNIDWDEFSPEGNGVEDCFDQENDDEDEAEEVFSERAVLLMPSSLGKDLCVTYGWESLAEQEKELRIAQADECLENIRLALGHKSLLLRTSVRGAKGQKGKTRAWNEVDRISETIAKEVSLYHQARQALFRLMAEENILRKYRPILSEDLKMSGDVVEENRVGQRNDALAWFWRLDGAGQHPNDDWMQECKCLIL